MQPGDGGAVDEAEQRADQQRDDHRDPQGQAHIGGQLGAQHAGHGQHGANGNVDAAGEHDQRHADGRNAGEGHLTAHAENVAQRQEGLACQGEDEKLDDKDEEYAIRAVQVGKRELCFFIHTVHL